MDKDVDYSLLQVLISTCNNRIAFVHEVIDSLPSEVNVIIIHQRFIETLSDQANQAILTLQRYPNVKLVLTNEKGLARSRNRALSEANASLLLIADDDVKYINGAIETIIRASYQLAEASVITFRYTDENRFYRKKYSSSIFKRGYLDFFKVSSVEILVRREALLRSGVFFDESFGLGAKYPVSEENIFLFDLYRSGEQVYYYPADILIHPCETSGSSWNAENLVAKGALFRRLFRFVGLPLLFIFLLKHLPKISSQIGVWKGVKLSLKGYYGYSR